MGAQPTLYSHPGTATDNRRFPPWLGRTVRSSSANGDAPAELHIDDDGCDLPRPAGAGAGAIARTAAGAPFHDIPSRSANSVFTLANERRSNAHCAGVVISAAKSSRRSAASFARRRAARARARGVVMSCWMGSDLHVGVGIGIDAEPVIGLEDARTGFGVASIDVDADIKLDIESAAEGANGAKPTTSDDIRAAREDFCRKKSVVWIVCQ